MYLIFTLAYFLPSPVYLGAYCIVFLKGINVTPKECGRDFRRRLMLARNIAASSWAVSKLLLNVYEESSSVSSII